MSTADLAAIILAFLLGSVPFGLLLTRAGGLGDIRAIGSGNIGATNVLRTGRKDLAAATLLLDLLKGTAAVLLSRALLASRGVPEWAGLAAVLGHTLTPWLRLLGGKGVATGAGVLLGIAWPVGLIVLAVWLLVALASRLSSAAALTACAVAPLAALMVKPYPWAVPVLALWIAWRHRANVRRLLAGAEPRIGRS